MGRLRDIGWAIRDRVSGTAVAILLALAGLGAGVAGIVIALDAKDRAEEAESAAAAPVSIPVTTAPDPEGVALVEELHDRVGAIEESVAELREEDTTTPPQAGEITAPKEPTVPETPGPPGGIEVPGVPEPEANSPARP